MSGARVWRMFVSPSRRSSTSPTGYAFRLLYLADLVQRVSSALDRHLRRHRKAMLWASLFTMLFGLTEPLFVPEY